MKLEGIVGDCERETDEIENGRNQRILRGWMIYDSHGVGEA